MTRIAANLSMMFTEVPLLERFERAARAGFSAVELQFPYEAPAAQMRARLDAAGQAMVLHNLPAGDFAAGERGLACVPGREAEFRDGVVRAIQYATTLGVPRCNCLAGKPGELGQADAPLVRRTFVENLRFAAKAFDEAGLVLLIEPINPIDIPGFWLNSTAQALSIIDEVGSDNLFVQYDIYHAQRVEGELAATMQKNLARIGHIQFADNPGRGEPGTGEINFPFLFEHLKRIGWAGDIGAEYKPSGRTEDSLAWFAPLQSLFDKARSS